MHACVFRHESASSALNPEKLYRKNEKSGKETKRKVKNPSYPFYFTIHTDH
jgi:hypothetical protein